MRIGIVSVEGISVEVIGCWRVVYRGAAVAVTILVVCEVAGCVVTPAIVFVTVL